MAVDRGTFVGREPELDQFWGQLSTTLRGHPGVMLVNAEAGMGKTRLLRECGDIAARLGIRVVRGRAFEDSATPYLSLMEMFDLCAGEPPSHVTLTGGEPESIDVSAQRMRFFGAFVRRVIELAQREPMLWVLDDLHWTDSASLELLGNLVFSLSERAGAQRVPLLILAGYRPAARGQRLATWLLRIQPESIVHTLELRELATSEIGALLESLGLERAEHELINAVQQVTRGHPLFIRELVDHLKRHELDEKVAPTLLKIAAARALKLPRNLSSALAERVSGLAAEDVGILTQAAAVSDAFVFTRIVEISGADPESIHRALDRAVDADLLYAEGSEFHFRHPLIRELLLQRAGAEGRRVLHSQIARVYLGQPPSAALSFEIAQHLLAAQTGDARLLLEHTRVGAQHASLLFAWSEAAQLYAAAANVASKLEDVPAQEAAQLYLQGALCHHRDFAFESCLYLYTCALNAFTRAGDLAGQAETLRQRTRALYASGSAGYGELIEVLDHERLLEEPMLPQAARGVLYEALALAYWNARDTSRAELLARDALAIASAVGDRANVSDANFTLGFVHLQAGRLHASLAAYMASFEEWTQIQDSWSRIAPLQRMCMVRSAFGELEEATRLCEEAEAQIERVGHSAEAAFVAGNRALLALARGELDAVQSHARKALSLARKSHFQWAGLSAICALTWARAFEGRFADAQYAIELALTPGEVFQVPDYPVQLGLAIWKIYLNICMEPLRSVSAQREQLLELLHRSARTRVDADTAFLICMLIECATRLELEVFPAALHERLAHFWQHGMEFAPYSSMSLARVLALSAVHQGRDTDAERLFESALSVTARAGALPELGRSLVDYAAWLLKRAQIDRAREYALRAYHVLAHHPCQLLHGRARELVFACGVTQLPALQVATDLRAADAELLRQIAYGRSDKDIARDLMLPEQRVAELIDALFDKLGVDGRGLATAYAFAHGLVGTAHKPMAGTMVLMVTDMVDFTGMVQRLGDLHARSVIHAHNRIIRQELLAHEGREVTHTGDGIMAEFQLASAAASCAVAIQRQFVQYCREHPETPIRVRIGLNAGKVLSEEDRLFGAALIAAVRICANAKAGHILLSERVHELLEPVSRSTSRRLAPVVLKGFTEQVALYEIAVA